MALTETTFDHIKGNDKFSLTAAEQWSIAMVKKLKARYPDEVEILHTNPDGSMLVHLPFDWMRVVPKRKDTLTDRQRAERANSMRTVRMKRLNTGI
jgi:hypothetical protein